MYFLPLSPIFIYSLKTAYFQATLFQRSELQYYDCKYDEKQ